MFHFYLIYFFRIIYIYFCYYDSNGWGEMSGLSRSMLCFKYKIDNQYDPTFLVLYLGPSMFLDRPNVSPQQISIKAQVWIML